MKKKHYIEMGNRLRKAREALGLQQNDMAEAVGVTPPYLSSLENGKRTNPAIAILFKISKRYHISLDYLVNGCGEMFLPTADNEEKKPEKFPPDFNTIDDAVWLMKNSIFAKNAILSHIVRFYLENEDFIGREMERARAIGNEASKTSEADKPGKNGREGSE